MNESVVYHEELNCQCFAVIPPMLLGLGLSASLRDASFRLGGFPLGLKKVWVKIKRQKYCG